ncbi:rhomboid family intramembrane serine protease [Actinomadura scrupuli]|uniref:rhomboid family intramembrane serine protease n=1 Tax=Actinomadura scrupuli TaxID=559629 RepID=UPI003D996C66
MSTDSQPEPDAPAGVPSCYRHPGRETYVRCTRCDRYICPECMRDAAVGHQCVECVRAANKTVRQPRTVFGGRLTVTPVVTYTLIALNLLGYLAELADEGVVTRFGMLGEGYNRFGQLIPGLGVADGEWYRLITGAFLHSPPNGGSLGISHILFNMWALWAVGPQLEHLLGRTRFAVLYLLAALGGNVLCYLLAPDVLGVGASGAIYGLFGAFFVVLKRLRADPKGIVILLAINLVITFWVPGISWQAHIGGLVTGAVVALAYAYAPARHRQAVHIGSSVAVLVLLLALVAVKTVQLTS